MRTISKAILLAAGRGTRLRPHTDTTPKPLLPVKGRPSLDLILQSLAKAGIDDVCVVTHYLEEQIADYLNHQSWIQNTSTAHQKSMNGTGGAVLAGWDTIDKKNLNGPVLISATDYLLDELFYSQLHVFHQAHDAEISISLKTVPEAELSLRSSVRIDENNVITEVVEKPAEGTAPSAYSANLLYVVPANFHHYLQNLQPSSRGELEVQDAINQLLRDGGRAKGLLQTTPREWGPDLL